VLTGSSHSTVLTIISEVGSSIEKFASAKKFSSWLRLNPDNRKTGGKIISSRSNRMANALRNAAKTERRASLPIFPTNTASQRTMCGNRCYGKKTWSDNLQKGRI